MCEKHVFSFLFTSKQTGIRMFARGTVGQHVHFTSFVPLQAVTTNVVKHNYMLYKVVY